MMRYTDRPASSLDQNYEGAICAIINFGPKNTIMERIEKKGYQLNNEIPETEVYLSRIGVTLSDLSRLSVIHIAGTKGKGSTCSFVERILREHGYKTGFFSSPHLIEVTERIRINGQPIPKDKFAQYFWDVHNMLSAQKEHEEDMPSYFKFFTIMALKVFLCEEVDVAVVEVGVGGEYDATNVIRNPVACGITKLDIDHTKVLGTTIDSIAWHKAGIMKTGVPTFTIDQQPGSSLAVLLERAKDKKAYLYVVPPLESYGWGPRPLQLGLAGSVQHSNASLALQLSRYWIQNHAGEFKVQSTNENLLKWDGGAKVVEPFTLDEADVCGLRSVVWPGRSQELECGPLKFFIDVASNVTSMKACIDWFTKASQLSAAEHEYVYRVLFFNSRSDRDPQILLQILAKCSFNLAVFPTSLATISMTAPSDRRYIKQSKDEMLSRCEQVRNCWIRLMRNHHTQKSDESTLESCENPNFNASEKLLADDDINFSESLAATDVPSIIFPCISDALSWLSFGRCPSLNKKLVIPPTMSPPQELKEASQVQVLVTGSFHLVGSLLGILNPGGPEDLHHLQ